MDIKDITPANSELVVTTVKSGINHEILEDVLGISSYRKMELVMALNKYKSQLFTKEQAYSAEQGTIFEVISRIARTPNELFWFAYRLGTFSERLREGYDTPDPRIQN